MSPSNGMEDKRGDNQEEKQLSEKASEYLRELLEEKLEVDPEKSPHAYQLIDQEITRLQSTGKLNRDQKYVDIYREKPIKVSVKVLIPVREHPKFNFVGKLLGPKGNSMKRLQEETMCKMAVLGRGSMKDRQKEEELRKSLEPKYAHLQDELHVEISALAPPAEAHARIAFALAEVRKYLIPDNNDNIRHEQMREMELVLDEPIEERRPSARGGMYRPSSRPGPPGPPVRSGGRPLLAPHGPPSRGPPPAPRPGPASKGKVISIFDKLRMSSEQSHGYESTPPPSASRSSHHEYDYHGSSSSSRYPSSDRYHSSSAVEELYPPPLSSRYAASSSYEYEDDVGHHGSSHEYYDAPEYPVQRSMKYEDSSSRAWKSYKTTTTGTSGSGASSRYRSAPYSRPSK